MRKKYTPPIFPIALSVVLVIVLVIGYWQVNKQEKRINQIQSLVLENRLASTEIVNFINASLAQVQNNN